MASAGCRSNAADWGYLEIPTLLVVENGGKHTGGIETRETEPIDRAVQPHQCSGTHVADDSVVFYRLIRHESSLLPRQAACRLLHEAGAACRRFSLCSQGPAPLATSLIFANA